MGSTVKQKKKRQHYTMEHEKIWNESGKKKLIWYSNFLFDWGKPNCYTRSSFLCNVEIGYSNGPIHTLNHGFEEIKFELLCVGSHLKTRLDKDEKKNFKLSLLWVGIGWVRDDDESFDHRNAEHKSTSIRPRLASRVPFCFAFRTSQ